MKPRGPIPVPAPQRPAKPAVRKEGPSDSSLQGLLSHWSGRSTATPVVQAKLQVGLVDDAFEREADAFAKAAVKQLQSSSETPTNPPTLSPAPANVAQPSPDPQAETPESESDTPQLIRPKLHFSGSSSGGSDAPVDFTSRLRGMGSGGSLPSPLQQRLGRLSGTPLNQVRIHTGSEAHELSKGIHARAFTFGQDIFFGQGQYNPATEAGQELIAHEVAHVGQQGGVGVVQRAEEEEGDDIEEYVFQEDREEDFNYILPDPYDPETDKSIVTGGVSWATRFRWALLLQEYPFPEYLLETEYTRIRGLLLIKALDEATTLTASPALHQPCEEGTWSAPSDAMIMDDFAPGFPKWWSSTIETEFTLSSANKADARAKEEEGWRILNLKAQNLPEQLANHGYPIFGKAAQGMQKGWRFVLWNRAHEVPIHHPVFDFARAIEAYREAGKSLDAAKFWEAMLPKYIQSIASSYHFIFNPEELPSVRGIGQWENRFRLNYLPGKGSEIVTGLVTIQDILDPSRHIPLSPIGLFHLLSMFPVSGFEDGKELFEEKQEEADDRIANLSLSEKVETLAEWSVKNGYLIEEAGEYLKKILNDPGEIISEIGESLFWEALKKVGKKAATRGVPIIGWILTVVDIAETAIDTKEWIDRVKKVIEYIHEITAASTVEDLQYLSHHLSTVVSTALLEFLMDKVSDKIAGKVSDKMLDPSLRSHPAVVSMMEHNPGVQAPEVGVGFGETKESKEESPAPEDPSPNTVVPGEVPSPKEADNAEEDIDIDWDAELSPSKAEEGSDKAAPETPKRKSGFTDDEIREDHDEEARHPSSVQDESGKWRNDTGTLPIEHLEENGVSPKLAGKLNQMSKVAGSHEKGVEEGRKAAERHGIELEKEWVNPDSYIGKYGRGIDDIGYRNGKTIILEWKGGSSEPQKDQMKPSWVGRKIAEVALYDPKFAKKLLEDAKDKKLEGRIYSTPGNEGKARLYKSGPANARGVIKYPLHKIRKNCLDQINRIKRKYPKLPEDHFKELEDFLNANP